MTPEERMRIETAIAWRPTPGDTLTGFLITTRKRETEYGTHPVLVVRPEGGDGDGYVAVHAFHSVLKNALTDLKPKTGERLTIAYNGKITPDKGGNPYHSYIAFNPDAPDTADEYDWDAGDTDEPAF